MRKETKYLRRAAGVLLVLLTFLAGWDALWAFGVFFVMNNAEGAIPDNFSWLFAGPFSFFPAILIGLLCVSLCRIEEVDWIGRKAIWLPAAWLVYGAFRFAWLEFFGRGFTAHGNHGFDLLVVSFPMFLTVCCLLIFRPPIDPERETAD